MNQQINLYQPIFRQERKLFSLRTVSIALAAISIALLGIWAFGARNVAHLARDVGAVRQQLQAQQQMAEKAGNVLSASTSPEAVQANIKNLSAQLADRTRALDLLRNGAAGSSEGFAGRMAALARRHTDGLWLERMLLGPSVNGASGGALWLEGRSVDAQLVPLYLQQLANEPELSGARFDEVVIDRHLNREAAEREARSVQDKAHPARVSDDAQTESTVRFSVSSRSLRESPEPRS